MDTVLALTELGIPETEARFYLAALELGGAAMREVAEKAGISRTNAYDVFNRLRQQGLVAEVSGGNGNGRAIIVVAAPPSELSAMLERRQRRLQLLMPDLESIHARSHPKPRVRYYEGIEGIKTVLNGTLQCRSKQLCAILSMKDLYEVPGKEWMNEHVQRRIEAGVSLCVVRSPLNDVHPLWADSAEELRQVRYAPDQFVFNMSLYIYDDRVAIISSHRENFGMTIDSAEFASMQRYMFEALWLACRPANGKTADTQKAPGAEKEAGKTRQKKR